MNPSGKNLKLVLAVILFFLPCLSVSYLLNAAVNIFGYFENRAFVVENPDESWETLKEKLRLGDYNRLRLQYRSSPSKKVTVNVAVDYYSYHGMMNSAVWDYIGPGLPTASNVKIDMDRAYVDLHFKSFDMSVGKQRVALGVSYLWAPLDVFNRVNVFEPKEEKAGVNAFKVYVPLGASSSFTGVFSPDIKVGTSTSALRAKTQVWGVDAAVTLMRFGAKETSIYGVDLRGENFLGWWLEAGYFISPDKDNGDEHARRKDVKLVLGFDYTFPLKNGLYWLNEFFYDSTGREGIENYEFIKLFTGERFTVGKYYFFSMLRYAFNDFLSASVSYIGNLGDGSYILNPMIQYELSQSIMVYSGFYLPLGTNDGEYNRFKENTFFLWIKINF